MNFRARSSYRGLNSQAATAAAGASGAGAHERTAWVGLGSRPPAAALYAAALALTMIGLIVDGGLREFCQVTFSGLVSGSYYALAAVGLTLMTAMLRVINFAHGDILTVGAYTALGAHVGLGLPMIVAAAAGASAGAGLCLVIEFALWRPMRNKRSSVLPLMLMTIGLGFVLREGLHFFVGSVPRQIEVDVISTVDIAGVRLGTTQLIVLLVGTSAIVGVGLMLRFTSVGKQMRAVSDNRDLAETAGINTRRVILTAWLFAGSLAGLAGVLYAAALGVIDLYLGFNLLLGVFAAMVLGGVGNAYGALAGGLLIGLSQEWSTLLIDARWKVAVGFVILVLTLIFRPQGIFGHAASV